MYLQHFGLKELPFRIVPDTRLFFEGAHRGNVLAALRYAILNGEGIVKVVGEVGSGKTMLCRMLENGLPELVDVVYIANPGISPDNILNIIAFELGLCNSPLSKLEVMQKLQSWLLQQHRSARRVVVFIEEAQGMPLATLEEVRLLSNLETEKEKLLQIVLFGQPELDDNLQDYSIRQLWDRIAHHLYLSPLDSAATQVYLNFRMLMAGYRGDELFSRQHAKKIVRHSAGLLRRINLLADKTLLACYADGLQKPRLQHIRIAAEDCHFSNTLRQRDQRWFAKLVALSVCLALGLILIHSMPSQIGIAPVMALQSSTQVAQAPVLVKVPVLSPRISYAAELKTPIKPIAQNSSQTLLAQRLQVAESWLSRAPGQQRSIQLLSVSKNSATVLESYLSELSALTEVDANKIFVYASQLQGRSVYSVLYGQYESRQEAKKGMDLLPHKIQQQGPFLVRSVQGVKDEISSTTG